MGCFDTDKLSDSRTGKRLRHGPFAENGRGLPLVQIELTLERSTPDNVPAVACGVLKPSAQQQGVQGQRHDGVLGGPRCRKESRQPTHAAWSSASAACIIHQLHASNAESPGFYFWKKLCMDLRAYILNLVPVFCTGYLRKMII